MNLNHNNPEHKLAKEANQLLAIIDAANLRHMPNHIPTWKSYGLHKVCKCSNCNCPRLHRSSCIDNAYISLDIDACLRVMDDSITDHFPLLVKIKTETIINSKLESVWRRDIAKIKPLEFETALGVEDWSAIYKSEDPNIILDIILSNINSSLDIVAPLKLIKFRRTKPLQIHDLFIKG